MSKENNIKTLKDVKEIFGGMNQEFWIIGGALLGHVRDKDFLPWDDDIDIAMKHPCPNIPEKDQREWLSKWLQPFRDAGFYAKESTPKLFFGWILVLYKNQTRIDISVYEEYNGDLCHSYIQYYLYYPKHLFENMKTINIGGEEFNIPTPVEEFLFLKYGENWKIPKAPIQMETRTLTKSAFDKLKPIKLDWRDEINCVWTNEDLRQRMIDYYNTIVYIAGCWDLFHYGHLRMLQKCKKLGYKVIVGCATDDYIRRYKKHEPMSSYEFRAEILKNLKGVYKVIPHNEKASVEVYDREGINVLVIGEDYSDTPSHAERLEEAKKRNIKIMKLPTTEGVSSTLLKQKKAAEEELHSDSWCMLTYDFPWDILKNEE